MAMQRAIGAVKAAYNFFAGDAVILTGVVLAFVAAYLLVRLAHANLFLVGVVFVGLILLGLTATLGHERESARRAQQTRGA
jgi:hypothetical protein